MRGGWVCYEVFEETAVFFLAIRKGAESRNTKLTILHLE